MYQIAKKKLSAHMEGMSIRRSLKLAKAETKIAEVGNPYRCTCQPAPAVQTCQVHALARIMPEACH